MLKFYEELSPQVEGFVYRAPLTLTNIIGSGASVAFKVKTTSPNSYTVKPSQGILEKVQSCTISITMVGLPESIMLADHKFQVQVAACSLNSSEVRTQYLRDSDLCSPDLLE